MMQVLRLAGALPPEAPGPARRQYPADWVPVWSDLSRVRYALDEALVYLTVLGDQVEPDDLVLRDLRWQTAEAARLARAYYQTLVDRLAGATPAQSHPTSSHDPPAPDAPASSTQPDT